MVNLVLPSWPAIRPRETCQQKLRMSEYQQRTDGAGQVVSVKRLHVLDLERVKVEVIQTKQGDRILARRVRQHVG
jgi:hypothetical protein